MATHKDHSPSQLKRQGKITQKQLERMLIKRDGKRAGTKEFKRLISPGG